MKKILLFLALTVMLLVCLISCGGGQSSGQGGGHSGGQNNDRPSSEHTHSFGEWTVTKEPTCIEEGQKSRSCSCGEKQNEVIETVNHTESVVLGKDASCTELGLTDGIKCSVCGEFLVEQETISLKEHTLVTVDSVKPTCSTTGLTEGKKCLICQTFVLKQEVIPTVEHTYDDSQDENCNVCGYIRAVACIHNQTEIIIGYPASCIATGLTDGEKCEKCGEVLIVQQVIPLKAHTEVVDDGVEATCTNPGLTQGKHCSACGTPTVTQAVIPANGHTEAIDEAVEATCTATGLTEGKHCSVCGDTLIAQQIIPMVPHTEEIIPAVEATCSENGLTEGLWCKICETVLVDQVSTPKLSHTYDDKYDETCNKCGYIRDAECAHREAEVIEGYAATCTATGLTDGSKCKKCGEILVSQTVISPINHTVEIDAAVEATCTSTGLTEGSHCSVCNHVIIAQTVIQLIPHTEDIDEGIEATCTSAGLTEGKHCSVCGTITVPQEVIQEKGHTEAIDKAVAATCTSTGLTEGKHCSVCKTVLVEQVTVPVIEHIESEWLLLREPTEFNVGQKYTECTLCEKILNVVEIPATHTHNYTEWIEVPSYGCSAFSYSFKYCLDCGNKVIDAPEGADLVHPHEFEKIEKAATCTEDGIVYKFVCKNCNFVAAEKTITAPGHKFGNNPSEQYNKIYHTRTCTVCGKDVKLPHSYDGLDVIDAPSCVSNGYAKGSCVHCGETDGIILLAYGHWFFGECSYVNQSVHTQECIRCDLMISEGHFVLFWSTVLEPTCTDAGLAVGYCIDCGGRIESAISPRHSWKFVSFTPGSSCLDGGYINLICKYCGLETTVELTEPGHDYVYSYTITEPTCTTDGSAVKKCLRCGDEAEYTLSALGHLYVDGVTVKAPDCYNTGLVRFTCQRDGCDKIFEAVTKKSHSFDDGVITKAPTCTSEGEIVYTCRDCGVTVEYVLPVVHTLTEHEYIDATCTDDGNISYYTCDGCGKYFSYYVKYEIDLECDGRTYITRDHFISCYTEIQYEDTVIHAYGHEYTCYFNAYDSDNHYRRCLNGCGTVIDSEEHTLENEWVIVTVRVESGYEYYLVETRACTKCGYDERDDFQCDIKPAIKISEEHNTFVVIPPTLPTCTESGLDVGLKCGVCDEILYAQVILDPLGHEYVGGCCIRCGDINASQGLAYTLSNDGTYYIVSGIGTCTDTDIVIPSTYNGLPVKEIGSSAFGYCSSLTSVVIGDSVTSIGSSAFYYCSSLTSVVIGDSVTSIGSSAFSWCTSLTSIEVDADNANFQDIDGNLYSKDGTKLIQYAIGKIATSFTIPDSVTSIGSSAFYYCKSLTSITIPEGVTSIGSGAFERCTSLTSITIPESVTSIGSSAFEYCGSLTSITIPDSVTSIGSYAFGDCDSLTSITIPDSVTSIGSYAFGDCDSLTSIKVDANNINYKDIDGNLYSKDGTQLIQYAIGKTATSFTIPESVTSIGSSAFSHCTSLTSITIPESVTSIGFSAFSHCTSLTSITIPESVTSISDFAFYSCDSLTSITIPESVTSIGSRAFYYCTSLTSITIPESVTSIGSGAFSSCSSLYVVYNNSDLLIEVGSSDNGNVGRYAKILVNNGVTTYADDGYEYILTDDGFLFDYDGSQYRLRAYIGGEDTVTLPTDINGIAYKIYEMRGVVNVIIPDSVTSIGSYAFYSCDSLTSITIPDSVTSIGSHAFYGCSSLMSITIPESVTSISDFAFHSCDSLTSITIPESVTSISDFAFSDCDSLTSIKVDANNINYKDIDGNLYSKDGTQLIQYAIGKAATSFTIPEGVTSIAYYAFSWCTSLTSITIPEGVTSIGSSAFYYCKSLTSITILDGVTSIGSGAFQNCTSLTSVEIGDGVTSIGDHAFSDCTSLTSITIPDSVTSIGSAAFYYCTSLTSITIPDSVKSISSSAFADCTKLTIYCEAASKPDGWNSNWNSSNRPVEWGYTEE